MGALNDTIGGFTVGEDFAIPDTWTQGRTAYGGLTAALAVAAAQASADDELPPLRSAQFAFTAPAAEAISMHPHSLRRGRSATSFAVEGVSGGQVAATASLIFSGTRESAVAHSVLAAPEVAAPHECPASRRDNALTPAFFTNFDVRVAGGAAPISRAEYPELLCWVRHLDATGVDPDVAVIALGDALPPAAMAAFADWAPVSTMSWTVNICADKPVDPNGWFLLRSVSVVAHSGYSAQQMTMWDAGGAPVLIGTQTVAVFG